MLRKYLFKLKPGVPRKMLFLAASIFWLLVAVKLLTRASEFFIDRSPNYWIIGLAIMGIAPFYYFVFRKVTLKYIRRIWYMTNERPCVFGFFNWKGYAMMAFMIGLGILTSMLPFIPKNGLNAFLISLGGSMFISSIQFIIAFFNFKAVNNNE